MTPPFFEVGKCGNPITGNKTSRPHISFSEIESVRTGKHPEHFDMFFDTWKEMQKFFLQAAIEATEQMKLEQMANAPEEALVDAIAEQFVSRVFSDVAKTMVIPPEHGDIFDEINQCLQIIVTNAGNIKDDRHGPILEQCVAIEDAVDRAKKAIRHAKGNA